jgi:branched-chain amino acid transport system permease protein
VTATLVIQALIDGILIGGVYAAIGMGMSIAWGVMGVVNWAHGEILMMALYISIYLTKYAGFDPYLTALVNIVVMGAFGYVIQRTAFNKLVNRGSNVAWRDILLITAGMSMLLQAVFNMIFGAEVKSVTTRYSGMFSLGDIMVSKPKTISFLVAIACCAALYYFIMKSEMGRALRATSQDRSTAQLMGINANQVYCICFAISLALVGLAAALLTPFYSVSPYVGASFCFKSFIIVALGGKGNIPGALVAGLVVGIIEKIGGLLWGDSIAQIIILVLFIVILLVMPDGLMVRKKKG